MSLRQVFLVHFSSELNEFRSTQLRAIRFLIRVLFLSIEDA